MDFESSQFDPDGREFKIVHGYLAENNREIAMVSRSIIQIMSDYASYIEVPDSDIAEGRVYAEAPEEGETGNISPQLIRIHCSDSTPDGAFINVSYRDHRFFIDDRDVFSKRSFYFLMLMFSFNERSNKVQALPVLTVPTN